MLCVEDRVLRVRGDLFLRDIADEMLTVGEGGLLHLFQTNFDNIADIVAR